MKFLSKNGKGLSDVVCYKCILTLVYRRLARRRDLHSILSVSKPLCQQKNQTLNNREEIDFREKNYEFLAFTFI